MARTLRLAWRASLLTFGTLAAGFACGSSDSGSSFAAPGTEQGECRANGECDEGLVCQFDVCVSAESRGGAGGGAQSSGGTSPTGGASAMGGDSSSDGGNGSGNEGGASAAGSAGEPGSSGGAGVECDGSHPLLGEDPPTRYCAEGDCYCPGADECLAEDVAAECCENEPLCGDNGDLAGIECSSMHPIIGPPRTCESGYCLCSKQGVIDACFPSDVAEYCCPPDVDLQCVE